MTKKHHLLIDLGFIGALLLINPILKNFTLSIRQVTDEILTYLAMAEQAIPKGLLFLPGWEHVDKGIILPPAFPFLIAIGNVFSQNSLAIAEIISHLSMLIAVIIIYFCVKQCTNRPVAIITALVVQSNYYYMLLGFWSLPEALFLCLLCLFLFLFFTDTLIANASFVRMIAIGITSAALFLTHPAGWIVIIFLLVWSLFQMLIQKSTDDKNHIRRPLLFILGFIILAGPYLLVLFSQTSHSPLTKHFRAYNYAVSSDMKSVEAALEQNASKNTFALEMGQKKNLALLENSTEILKDVLTGEDIIKEPHLSLIDKIKQNINSFVTPLHGILIWLFLFSLLTPFISGSNVSTRSARFVLPVFLLFFLVSISMFDTHGNHFLFLLYPLGIMQIAFEMYHMNGHLMHLLPEKKAYLPVSCGIALVFLGGAYLFQPPLHTDFTFPTQKGISVIEKLEIPLRDIGEPIFAVSPLNAYRSGFTFRTLPNDTLEKISAYGKATGVKYLLYDWKESSNLLYGNATWMRGPGFVKSKLVTSVFRKGSITIYELL